MLKCIRLLCFLALFATTASAQEELIGGTVVDQALWPASPWVGNCSSTLIGPRVLLTAAHCVGNGATRTFTISGVRYQSKPCVHHPEYRGNSTADWALCALNSDVPVKAESLAQAFEFRCATGTEVTWTGFGCTRWGQGIDGKFRIGNVPVVQCPGGRNYDTITRGSVALCSGDSGGGGYIVFPDGSRRVIGVNSRSNTRDTSYVSSTYTDTFRDWAANFAVQQNVEICGMGADASKCRGTVSEPPPPPPPPAQHTIYRHYNAGAFDHYWSRSNVPPNGYVLEGGAFNLFTEPGTGKAPIYSCFVPNIGHFVSRDAACEGQGVWNEGVLGFVYTSSQPQSVALYRCYARMAGHLHFLTTLHTSECTQAGHTVQGQQGYAPT